MIQTGLRFCASTFALCVSIYAQNYSFTTLNDHNNGGAAAAINDAGLIAGDNLQGGFTYENDTFKYIGIYVGGINNSGTISGNTEVGSMDEGVIVNGAGKTTFFVPGSLRTLAYQINDLGVVVGYYTEGGPNSPYIFTYDGTNFTTLTLPPEATFAFPYGINNAGEIVGEYGTTSNTLVQFLYDGTTFHTINCPDGTANVELTGISNSGIVFGWCYSYPIVNSQWTPTYFFYKDGVYSIVDTPGQVNGMNQAGEIVGRVGYPLAEDSTVAGFIGTPVALRFVPVTPCRVADTRLVNGSFGGPELTAGTERDFAVPGSTCGIPSNATAYSLNVTAVADSSLGYLSIWPAGQTQPLVSTLNFDGRVKANSAIVPAGTNGAVAVFVSDSRHVILDINGYFVQSDSATLAFYPVTPCRIADTRRPNAPLGGPYLTGGVARSFPVQSSSCNLPATAQAYSLNVTAVPHGGLGYLSIWPAGETQPVVSTLNSDTGTVTANAAIVPAGTTGTNGAVNLYASNDSDVIVDVNGYFAPAATGGLSLYTVAPCRLLDTRNGFGTFAGVTNMSVIPTACIPAATAQAVVLNATVVPAAGLSYLTLWPVGLSQPLVSALNASDGAITSNMAIVPAANGSISAYSTNPTQLILDIAAYFAP